MATRAEKGTDLDRKFAASLLFAPTPVRNSQTTGPFGNPAGGRQVTVVKLSARDAKRFLRNPDPDCGAVLIYGPETMRIADYAKRTIDAVVGKDGRKEMRVNRVDAESAVSDAGFLSNLLKSAGFFSGKRAVQLDGASDSATDAVSFALDQRG